MQKAEQIKLLARECGFDACGIAPATCLNDDLQHLDGWLAQGFNGTMAYMQNHREKRTDVRRLVEGTRSVVVVLLNYFSTEQQKNSTPHIARYAWGNDYHFVVKQMLSELLQRINEEIAPCQGVAFCDSAPVFERRLAEQAGLGWIGKSAMLINPEFGSYCFIGELLLDIELPTDTPMADRCGNCTACLQACPTQALQKAHTLNASRCLSYQTIEHKGNIEAHLAPCAGNRLFGCDTCLEVCPWNRKARQNHTPTLQPSEEFLKMTREDWEHFSRSDFRRLFKNSPLQRAGYRKLRNRLDEMGFTPNQ